jgi:hypothetical protein
MAKKQIFAIFGIHNNEVFKQLELHFMDEKGVWAVKPGQVVNNPDLVSIMDVTLADAQLILTLITRLGNNNVDQAETTLRELMEPIQFEAPLVTEEDNGVTVVSFLVQKWELLYQLK